MGFYESLSTLGGHVLGVGPDALHGFHVVEVQHAHLGAVRGIQDVDVAVKRPGDDELRIGWGGLQQQGHGVDLAHECLPAGPSEGINHVDELRVGWEGGLQQEGHGVAVACARLQAGPKVVLGFFMSPRRR